MGRLKPKINQLRAMLFRLTTFGLAVVFIGLLSAASLFSVFIAPKDVKAAQGNMMLFWDGGSAPSGWSVVTTYDGRMPRGESVANFGTTGGNSTHANTVQSVSIANGNSQAAAFGGSTRASDTHTHASPGTSVSSASSLPAYRSLKLIKYDSGVPVTIPAGAIALFDDTPGIPASGWTRVSAQDAKVLQVNSSVTTGGSDNHTHTVTWTGSLGASSGTTGGFCFFCGSGTKAINNGHTHNAPSPSATPSASNMPPYVQPLLAKANADTDVSSVGITAMFDDSPGSLWVVRSDPGGPYYQKFLRPNSTYNGTGGGSDNHTHAATTGTSGAPIGSTGNNNGGGGVAADDHTHQVTANFYAGTSDPNYTGDNNYFLPSFFNVVVAERVTLALNTYRWYEDSDNEAVTDPWSVLDVPIGNMIPSLPAAYKPPDYGHEIRLRLQILVNSINLAASDIAFKLQYKAGTDSNCGSGSWIDVGAGGGGSIWRFATSGVTDNTTLSTSVLTSSVSELYSKSSPTATNPNAVSAGQTMEYDFHIENNGANPATQYSFRIVESTGGALSEYTLCPTLVTSPRVDNQLRHGDFFQDGVEKGFFWAN